MKAVCAAAVVLTLTCGVYASFELPSGPPERSRGTQQRRTITSTSTAILVDAVVRDKAGRLVTDLNANDFEVFEDGVAQTVDSFTRVSHGGGIGIGVAWRKPDRTIAVNPTEKPGTSASQASAPLEDAATV